jgi:hypothetical protein
VTSGIPTTDSQPRPSTFFLERLRGSIKTRIRVDPELAGGLREWLEDSLAPTAESEGSSSGIIRIEKESFGSGPPAQRRATYNQSVDSLVRCLFRQWITSGVIGDPMQDAIDALSISGDPDGILELVSGLDALTRSRLDEEVSRCASRIVRTWPDLNPAWLPRTKERITVPLCGGRVLLGATADLLIGAQATTEASVCIVLVEASRSVHLSKEGRRFCALLETLRSGAPPSRVATYSAATGELEVEAVDEHLLVAALLSTIDIINRHQEGQR